MKPITIGLLGLGTIGAGVVKVLLSHRQEMEEKIGAPIVLAAIAERDITTPRPGLDLAELPLTTSAEQVLNDPNIDIIIELIGGLEPARTFILKALANGKHVVTANKALLANHGDELYAEARKRGALIAFEAAVAGGIPIIRSVKEGLVANRITSLYGIVNGTSNYILSKMTDAGEEFDQVLKKAQAKGYAEADPTYDVEGIDSAHKLQILATLAFRIPVSLKQIYTEGITRISSQHLATAHQLGYRIKLLAIAKSSNGALELRVHPTMIPEDSPLASVSGVFNAIFVHGDVVDDLMFYGRGAGQMPTASSVWADVVEVAQRLSAGHDAIPQDLPVVGRSMLRIKPMEEIRSCYYLCVSALDQPSVLSQVAGILGKHNISIAAVIQKGRRADGHVPVVMMTHEAQEGSMQQALAEIDSLNVVADKSVLIRVEDKLS
jgi:homoserine dehydrogenase